MNNINLVPSPSVSSRVTATGAKVFTCAAPGTELCSSDTEEKAYNFWVYMNTALKIFAKNGDSDLVYSESNGIDVPVSAAINFTLRDHKPKESNG